MGVPTLSSRVAIFGVGLLLAACNPQAADETSPAEGPADPAALVETADAGPGMTGDDFICPGDDRCGRAPLTNPSPSVPMCEVEHVFHQLRCRADDGLPAGLCPGPGCPDGTDPAQTDAHPGKPSGQSRCWVVQTATYLDCGVRGTWPVEEEDANSETPPTPEETSAE